MKISKGGEVGSAKHKAASPLTLPANKGSSEKAEDGSREMVRAVDE